MILTSRPFKRNSIDLFIFIVVSTFTINVLGQQSQGDNRVIFFKETSILLDLPKESSYTRFTPSITDINSADLFLKEYFFSTLNLDTSVVQLDNYFRQYIGLLLTGERIIFINASCRKPDYFLQNTYYPKGGGKCYFRTLVDIDNKKILNFNFNAPK